VISPGCAHAQRSGGLKYGLYELFKSFLAGSTPVATLPLVLLLLAAASAEVVGSTALCPYEAARIRLVAEPSFAPGLPSALRRLVAEQGLHGVFGSLPAMYLKMIPYTMAQLVTYDSATRHLAAQLRTSSLAGSEWGTLAVALGSAALAALVASLASQPGDTLLSKLNQGRRLRSASGLSQSRRRSAGALTSSDEELEPPGGPLSAKGEDGGVGAAEEGDEGEGRAAGGGGCGPMCALAARLGPAGLMLGWQARLAHTGTIVLFQLLIYDGVKAAVGLPGAICCALAVHFRVLTRRAQCRPGEEARSTRRGCFEAWW